MSGGRQVVLTADRILMADYRLLFDGMLAASQTTLTPSVVMNRLLAPRSPSRDGRAPVAPLGLRRIEAALLVGELSPDDVTVVDEEHLAAAISDEPNAREFARLLMSGELRANSSLAMALEELGCPARSMTGREAGIVTQGGSVDALVDRVDDAHVLSLIDQGIVPVVAGFQGYYHDEKTGRDEVSILGRGGSNLTAVALADALGEDCCTMFTDVYGVFDCDPRENDEACQRQEVTAEELFTWDPFPRVIQKEAVEFACERGVDIWIRSAFDPEACGTIIRCR